MHCSYLPHCVFVFCKGTTATQEFYFQIRERLMYVSIFWYVHLSVAQTSIA